MDFFVSLLPVVLVVCICFFVAGLFLDVMYDGWLPFVLASILATMWTCQIVADPLSARVSCWLVILLLICATTAIFSSAQMVRCVVDRRRTAQRQERLNEIEVALARHAALQDLRARQTRQKNPAPCKPCACAGNSSTPVHNNDANRLAEAYERMLKVFQALKSAAGLAVAIFDHCEPLFKGPHARPFGFDPEELHWVLIAIRGLSADFLSRRDLIGGRKMAAIESLANTRQALNKRLQSMKGDANFTQLTFLSESLRVLEERVSEAIAEEARYFH